MTSKKKINTLDLAPISVCVFIFISLSFFCVRLLIYSGYFRTFQFYILSSYTHIYIYMLCTLYKYSVYWSDVSLIQTALPAPHQMLFYANIVPVTVRVINSLEAGICSCLIHAHILSISLSLSHLSGYQALPKIGMYVFFFAAAANAFNLIANRRRPKAFRVIIIIKYLHIYMCNVTYNDKHIFVYI